MDLAEASIEELEAQIRNRKLEQVGSIKRQLEEARAKVRELEAQLAEFEGRVVRHTAAPARPHFSIGEKQSRILTALENRDYTSASELTTLVGFGGASLRDALGALQNEGKVVKDGKARGTKYKLA